MSRARKVVRFRPALSTMSIMPCSTSMHAKDDVSFQHLEMNAVLGMNFLTDNGLRLQLDGTGVDLVGYFAIP
jgi:hypothetical protein